MIDTSALKKRAGDVRNGPHYAGDPSPEAGTQ